MSVPGDPKGASTQRTAIRMKAFDAGLVKAWLGYAALLLGRSGCAGLALLTVAGAAMLAQALGSDADHIEQRIAQLRAELKRAPAAGTAPVSAQSFVAQLPPAEQVPQFIEDVHRGALLTGLQIERAEYRAPTVAGGQVLRSQLVMPVTGNYPGIGQWLTEVLRAHPSAAIDEISVQRDAPATDQLHARIVLSHYSRSAP